MPTCLETCKTGITAGGIIGGLTGLALDVWVSVVYIRPFVDELTKTDNQTEEIITGVIATLALPLFVAPTMLMGKIIGPPTAIVIQGLYVCGASGLSAVSKLSIFSSNKTKPISNESESMTPEESERTQLLPSPELMV
jgi:hypothetical protein